MAFTSDSSMTNTMDNRQAASIAQPLHSNPQSESQLQSISISKSPLPPSSSSKWKRRPRHNKMISLTLMLLTLLTIITPAQAKYRLVPKKKRGMKNKNEPTNQKQHTIILKPKRKQESPPNLKLEATVSTNEEGEKVLLLSPESTKAVEMAMQSSNEVEVEGGTMKMEAKKPKKQLSVEEPEHSETEHKVLFYDPDELKTSPGEPPLPTKVFDEDGNEVDMAGKEAILVQPHPPKPKIEDATNENGEKSNSSNNSGNNNRSNNNSNSNSGNNRNTSGYNTSTILQTTQTQDQMIIISTVATMALLVGALSARRLRSRQFLSFCIENESLEDELAYDAAYTTQSTVGASSMYAGGGYDTFASGKYGGDLRWRGDLEKFDV